jgi:hypothetical protein
MAFMNSTAGTFCTVWGNCNNKDNNNHYIGTDAGISQTTGVGLTFIGYKSGCLNTSGYNNTGVGHLTLCANTTGSWNTAIGDGALSRNTTGIASTAIGWSAMTSAWAIYSVAIGYRALDTFASTDNGYNLALGACAGTSISGGCNLIIGVCSGTGITTGQRNTIIGSFCPAVTICTQSDRLLITWGSNGAGAPCGYIFGTAVGIGLGNTAPSFALHVTGEIVASTDITAYYSDRRLKENIIIIDCALDKVKKITGVKYIPNDLAKKFGFEDQKEHIGLLADEVEKILPEAVVLAPFDVDENERSISGENYKTIKYDKVIPLLIQAIKELDIRIFNLDKKILCV